MAMERRGSSFSASLKSELARFYPSRRCCRVAELSGLIHAIGSLHVHGDEIFSLEAHVENAAVVRKIYRLFRDLFPLQVEVTVRRSVLHRANDYLVAVPEQPALTQALNELGILDDRLAIARGVPDRLVFKGCCSASYLRGAFLGGGFASNPKGEYHFELATVNAAFAEGLKALLGKFDLRAGVLERARNVAVYLKSGDDILKVLAIMGAYNSLLKWEDARIVKEMRAQVNRMVNCDTANLGKAAAAAIRQIEDIKLIRERIGLDGLSGPLREIANLRLRNPSANIRELGELSTPPLNKSAVYHRLRRLSQLAQSLRGKV